MPKMARSVRRMDKGGASSNPGTVQLEKRRRHNSFTHLEAKIGLARIERRLPLFREFLIDMCGYNSVKHPSYV